MRISWPQHFDHSDYRLCNLNICKAWFLTYFCLMIIRVGWQFTKTKTHSLRSVILFNMEISHTRNRQQQSIRLVYTWKDDWYAKASTFYQKTDSLGKVCRSTNKIFLKSINKESPQPYKMDIHFTNKLKRNNNKMEYLINIDFKVLEKNVQYTKN